MVYYLVNYVLIGLIFMLWFERWNNKILDSIGEDDEDWEAVNVPWTFSVRLLFTVFWPYYFGLFIINLILNFVRS